MYERAHKHGIKSYRREIEIDAKKRTSIINKMFFVFPFYGLTGYIICLGFSRTAYCHHLHRLSTCGSNVKAMSKLRPLFYKAAAVAVSGF